MVQWIKFIFKKAIYLRFAPGSHIPGGKRKPTPMSCSGICIYSKTIYTHPSEQ